MKFLLVLLVVLVGVFIWLGNRRALREDKKPKTPAAPNSGQLEDMVRCPVCALHLPMVDAVKGARGMYCSAGHRQQAEG